MKESFAEEELSPEKRLLRNLADFLTSPEGYGEFGNVVRDILARQAGFSLEEAVVIEKFRENKEDPEANDKFREMLAERSERAITIEERISVGYGEVIDLFLSGRFRDAVEVLDTVVAEADGAGVDEVVDKLGHLYELMERLDPPPEHSE